MITAIGVYGYRAASAVFVVAITVRVTISGGGRSVTVSGGGRPVVVSGGGR